MKTHAGKPSLFVALVHETLKRGGCASRADLAEAVKCQAARLHLRYDAEIIGEAIDQVERVRGAARTGDRPPRQASRYSDLPHVPDRHEARAILHRYGVDVGGGSLRRRSSSRLIPL